MSDQTDDWPPPAAACGQEADDKEIETGEGVSDGGPKAAEDEAECAEVSSEVPEEQKAAEESAVAGSQMPRRHHAIYEIIDSEESYVNKLRFIAEKYIPLKENPDVQLPPDLEGKWTMVWGNWLQILEGHKEILTKIRLAFENDLDSVAGVFVAKERHMTSWYSKYCENHRKAQHIACDQYRDFFEQTRLSLRDKEDMNSHLMSPVQRCMRYSLLVGTVIDKAKKDGLEGQALAGWQKMLDIMRELPLKTESIMEASRIDNLEDKIRVTNLGQVRVKDVLRIAVLPGSYDPDANPPPSQLRFEQRKVFLFDQMMLVTEIKKSGKSRSDQFSNMQMVYLYRSKVKMNNMKYFSTYKCVSSSPAGEDGDELLFCVCDTTPGANLVYVFDPATAATRTRWVVELRQMEKQQMDFLKILQNPVMGPAGAEEPSACSLDTAKKTKDKTKEAKAENKKKGKLSFSGKSRKSRAETSALPRPQSSRESRKSSCPDAEAVGELPDAGRSAASKELKKVPSEVGSSGSHDQECQKGHGITKKKSGINFTSLQSFFTNKKSKSRSDSKLNPA